MSHHPPEIHPPSGLRPAVPRLRSHCRSEKREHVEGGMAARGRFHVIYFNMLTVTDMLVVTDCA